MHFHKAVLQSTNDKTNSKEILLKPYSVSNVHCNVIYYFGNLLLHQPLKQSSVGMVMIMMIAVLEKVVKQRVGTICWWTRKMRMNWRCQWMWKSDAYLFSDFIKIVERFWSYACHKILYSFVTFIIALITCSEHAYPSCSQMDSEIAINPFRSQSSPLDSLINSKQPPAPSLSSPFFNLLFSECSELGLLKLSFLDFMAELWTKFLPSDWVIKESLKMLSSGTLLKKSVYLTLSYVEHLLI